ncbi:MAG: hypothetical protein J0I32_13055 [Sphingobacteriales bacterium]|nr:hypothetical protein [Sphingobacteriales bacterium]OJW03133.1 MAG: hypothetical protein BGO52_02235 [Sphingobacteriales bacterium 44-61]
MSLSLLERIATFTLSLPIFLLLLTRLAWYRSFIALFIYYLVNFSYSFLSIGYIRLDDDFITNYAVVNNMVDAPLMLSFLSYFSRTSSFKRKIFWVVGGFLIYEAVILTIFGFNIKASTIIATPGLALTFTLSLLFAIHQVKITAIYNKAAGKAIIAASLFFGYIGFTYVYSVFYFMDERYEKDAQQVFFILTTLCSLAISWGIILERRRVKKLLEIKTAREELKALYSGEERKTIAPLETIVFNIDNTWRRSS